MKIQSEFFGKEIFGRNAPYDEAAVDDLRQIETDSSIATPISLAELKATLKKVNNRKSPGTNGIPIEMYKHLDDENLLHVLEILNKYSTDDIPGWNDVIVLGGEKSQWGVKQRTGILWRVSRCFHRRQIRNYEQVNYE